MSKVTMLSGAAVCVLALAASASVPSMPSKAAAGKTMNAAKTTKTAKASGGFLSSLWGDVKSVPADLKSLFVTDKNGKIHQVKMGPSTKVKGAGGQAATLASLKPGDHVHVTQKNGTALLVQASAAHHGPTHHHKGTAVQTH